MSIIGLRSNMDQPIKRSPDDTPPPPPPLHQSDADEDDQNVKQLQQCSGLYIALQECLVNSDRNWKACQREVQALKACNDRRKNDQRK